MIVRFLIMMVLSAGRVFPANLTGSELTELSRESLRESGLFWADASSRAEEALFRCGVKGRILHLQIPKTSGIYFAIDEMSEGFCYDPQWPFLSDPRYYEELYTLWKGGAPILLSLHPLNYGLVAVLGPGRPQVLLAFGADNKRPAIYLSPYADFITFAQAKKRLLDELAGLRRKFVEEASRNIGLEFAQITPLFEFVSEARAQAVASRLVRENESHHPSFRSKAKIWYFRNHFWFNYAKPALKVAKQLKKSRPYMFRRTVDLISKYVRLGDLRAIGVDRKLAMLIDLNSCEAELGSTKQ